MTSQPGNLAEIKALAQVVARGGHDAVGMGPLLAEKVRQLPPGRQLERSRPYIERASLLTLAASFENVPVDGTIPPSEVIRIPPWAHDQWIRRGDAQAYIKFEDEAQAEAFAPLYERLGSNGRFWFEVNWRVDSKQGFIYGGRTEVLSSAVSITGDGTFPAPKDWPLENNQTIEVRVRSLLGDYFTAAELEPLNLALRWIVVSFGAEPMQDAAKARSVRG